MLELPNVSFVPMWGIESSWMTGSVYLLQKMESEIRAIKSTDGARPKVSPTADFLGLNLPLQVLCRGRSSKTENKSSLSTEDEDRKGNIMSQDLCHQEYGERDWWCFSYVCIYSYNSIVFIVTKTRQIIQTYPRILKISAKVSYCLHHIEIFKLLPFSPLINMVFIEFVWSDDAGWQ